MDKQAIEIECDMEAATNYGPTQLDWADLTEFHSSASHVPGGATAKLPAHLHDTVTQLIDRERSSCQFLTFELHQSAEHLKLGVTSENLDAIPLIENLIGLGDKTNA